MRIKRKYQLDVYKRQLTNSVGKNKKLAENGAGAIVLKSLFEEQIMLEAVSYTHLDVYKRQGRLSGSNATHERSYRVL